MFKVLAFLAVAFCAGGCTSLDPAPTCNAFPNLASCVEPVLETQRRYQGSPFGGGGSQASVVGPGPTAGSANGGGPSPGATGGQGASAGSAEGQGSSAGSAAGTAGSPGSTNPAPTAGGSGACASICNDFINLCLGALDSFCPGYAQAVAGACESACGCASSVAPACVEAVLRVYGSCLGGASCESVTSCVSGNELAFQEIEALCEPVEHDCATEIEITCSVDGNFRKQEFDSTDNFDQSDF